MATKDQLQNAAMLLGSGRSDEDVEKLAGLKLSEILSLRALHAAERPPSPPLTSRSQTRRH